MVNDECSTVLIIKRQKCILYRQNYRWKFTNVCRLPRKKNLAAKEKIRCRNLVMSIGVCLSVASACGSTILETITAREIPGN